MYIVSIEDNVLFVTEGLTLGQSGRGLILTTHCYLYLYSPTYIHVIHWDNMNILTFVSVVRVMGESNGKLPLRICPGCSVPEPYRSPE
jgi:hypothetical protein